MPPTPPHQRDPVPADDEAALAMPTPTTTTEAALLADFDRYMQVNPPNPSDLATPLDRLAALHPTLDRIALQEILTSCEDDEHAAKQLLEGSAASTQSDAALAEQLQRRENRRAQGSSRHRRNDAPISLHKPVLDRMVSTLREIVVPALRAHFEELVLPNMSDTSAGVEYTLEDFQVSALSLPEDNISVKAAPDAQSIRVNVVNIYLELEVGKWSYEGKGLVPVKDKGTARVSVHGMSVALRLEPRWSHNGGTNVVITECDVTIDGVARFKTQGAAADWAYNAIAVVLKPIVVSYLKEAVADTVTKALAVHLRQWSFSRTLDEERPPAPPASSQSPVTAAE